MWEDFLLTEPKGQCRRVQSQDTGRATHTAPRCLLTGCTSLVPVVRGHGRRKVGRGKQTHAQGPEYSEHMTYTVLLGTPHSKLEPEVRTEPNIY